MKFLLQISSWIDKLNTNVNSVMMWLVLLSTLISAGNALVRYLFHNSSNAWLELQWIMFGAIFLLGASYTFMKNGHVRVDVLYSKYPPRVKVWVDLLGTLLFLIPTSIVVLITSIPWVINAFNIREMSPDAGGLPYWPVKFLIPIAFILLILQSVSEIIKRAGMLTGDVPMPAEEVDEELEKFNLADPTKKENQA